MLSKRKKEETRSHLVRKGKKHFPVKKRKKNGKKKKSFGCFLVYFLVCNRIWASELEGRAIPCIRFFEKKKKEETGSPLVRKERKHFAVKSKRKKNGKKETIWLFFGLFRSLQQSMG